MATADAVDDGSISVGEKLSKRAHLHGISDELIDPWCDLCFDDTSKKIEASGFCQDCNTFLCKSCLDDHKRFLAMRNHRILQDGRMPKTQADKPVKYLDCDAHKSYIKQRFCMDHGEMVCSQCIAEFHMHCKHKRIPDLCTDLGSIDIQDLRAVTETIKETVTSVKNDMKQNEENVGSKKRGMIKEKHELRDKLISKIENAYSSTISDVIIARDRKVAYVSNQVFALSAMKASLDQTLYKIDKVTGIDITPHVFVQLQNIVAKVSQVQTELADLKKQLYKVDISFSISPETLAFLSANNPLGSVKVDSSQLDLMMLTPEIAFPSRKTRKTKKADSRAGIPRDIMQIRAKKMTPLNVKMVDDKQDCRINGIAVTRHNILLLADWQNEKVKAVAPDSTLLSSLTLSGPPYDVTVIDDTTAAVSTNNEKLHILDISDTGSLAIKRTVSLGYWASGLALCYKNLVVVNWTEPKCVKMISLTGAELWSVSTDHNGQQLFEKPFSVTANILNDKMTILVTDWGMDTITLLDADNGDVVKTVAVKGKSPYGLTVDNNGNVYVCYRRLGEICVWSNDFSQSRILLFGSDLQRGVRDITYCNSTDEIFICYYLVDTVDRFKLS